MNHVTHPLSSADISIFSPESSKFCYIKKYNYRNTNIEIQIQIIQIQIKKKNTNTNKEIQI